MPLRLALMLALSLGLAGCDSLREAPRAAYPTLLPLDQLLSVPRPQRRPDPTLLARGAALRLRAAALMAN